MSLSIKKDILKQVVAYLDKHGITISFEELNKNIKVNLSTPRNTKSKPNFKVKPKPKKKFNVKKFTYLSFTNICDKYGFKYFPFNGVNEWSGPAIKVSNTEYKNVVKHFDIKNLNIITNKDCDFSIIHPIIFEKKDRTVYDESIFNLTTDSSSESDGEDTYVPWTYNGVRYLVNEESNKVYCYETNEKVGKKIDEYTIHFYNE